MQGALWILAGLISFTLGCNRSQFQTVEPEARKAEDSQPEEIDYPDFVVQPPKEAFNPKPVKGKPRHYTTPTRKLDPSEYPRFVDDIDFDLFDLAIERQLQRYGRKNLNGTIQLGTETYSLHQAAHSLVAIRTLAQAVTTCLGESPRLDLKNYCYSEFSQRVSEQFNVYGPNLEPKDPRYGEADPVFFTGYYTPVISVNSEVDHKTPYPIYRRPLDKKLSRSTRHQIDFGGVLSGRGLEIAYAPDLFELYLLHVEGGGKIEMGNGENKQSTYLSYSGTNRRKWQFISKYMMAQGMINNPSIAAQRQYLRAHPERAEEIYATCPSYVYFRETDHPPVGNDAVSLTDRRSIATDSKLYNFKGLLTFVKTKRLSEDQVGSLDLAEATQLEYIEYSRFYLDQDTGGAIKGKGRVDLYFGEGYYAEQAAFVQQQRGDLYYLMLKPGESATHKY